MNGSSLANFCLGGGGREFYNPTYPPPVAALQSRQQCGECCVPDWNERDVELLTLFLFINIDQTVHK